MRTVHRRVEQQVASKGDAVALVCAGGQLSYRELNARANALARHLLASGFHRGDIVVVALPISQDLVVAELAVLKAGGAYACPVRRLAYTGSTPFSVLRDGVALGIDVGAVLRTRPAQSPNLPVLVREHDPACVVADERGALTIRVTHSDITAPMVDGSRTQTDVSTRYSHWHALMNGGTLVLPMIEFDRAA